MNAEKFDEQVKVILSTALAEARRLKQHADAEHILLALLADKDSTVVKALYEAGIIPGKVRAATEYVIGHGDLPPDKVRLSARAKKVLELAMDEAHKANAEKCRPNHLLLAILSEGENVAAVILESFVGLKRLREYIEIVDRAK